MTRMVLTAFDPFGDDTINPTELILERFERPDLELHKIIVPTRFRAVRGKVLEALALQPDLVLSMGQAGGRRGLSLERVAINVMDARIPDNAGAKPTDQAIVPSGPAAYFSTLPLKAPLHKLKQAGIDASLSNSAGTFVCNALFYEFLHQTAQSKTGCAFLHVPYLPEQIEEKDVASMALEEMMQGVDLIIDSFLEERAKDKTR